ncbi:MAG: type II secretion system F family protein [Planctomycetes bacterium]|nr:type II secretion system F family protein [Planctomycetota bacterium]
MDAALLVLMPFLAGILLVAGAYSVLSDLFLRDRSRLTRRVDDEFLKKQRERVQRSALFKDLGQSMPSSTDTEESVSWREWFESLVEQAGLVDLTPRRLLSIMAGTGFGVGAVLGLLRQSPLTGLVAGLAGAAVPFLYVARKRKVRLERLMGQLPDAFDLMGRVIRAGQTMSQALQAVADEFDQPIAGEFSYCYEQQNLGLSPEVSLRDLARRTGLLEIKIFVLALLVQQQTGGNLAEMLDKLAGIMRERFRIRGKIRALTAEGRFQAAVLLALPPLLFLLILGMNRTYGQVLLDNPGLLIGMFVSEGFGALWIRKIINFDY